MVRVLFLFLTRFHVNVARSNGNPFRRNVPFIRKVHVLFKTRLIFSRINGPNVPFIRKVHVLFKTRLIFPRINGPINESQFQKARSPKLKVLGPLCNQTVNLNTDSKTLY